MHITLKENETMQDLVDRLMESSSLVYDIAPVAYWYEDLYENGRLKGIRFSDHLRGKLGYKSVEDFPDDLNAFVTFLHPDDVQPMLDNAIAAGTGKTDKYDLQYRIRRADGEYMWAHATGELVKDHQGKTVGMYGAFIDVTEEVKLRDRQENERRTKELIRGFSEEYDAAFFGNIRDNTYRILANVDAVAEKTDDILPLDEAMKSYVSYFVHPDDAYLFEGEFYDLSLAEKNIPVGESKSFEYRSKSGGEYAWYKALMRRIADDEVLIGFKNNDSEIVDNIIARQLIKDYDALYLVDISNNKIRPARPSRVSTVGDFGEVSDYSKKVRRFADTVAPQYKKDWVNFSKPAYLRKYMAEEDHREYIYELPEAQKKVRRMQIDVLERNREGEAVIVLLSFAGIDEKRAAELTLEKSSRLISNLSEDYLSLFNMNYETDEYIVVSMKNSTSEAKNHLSTAEAAADMARYIENYVHPDDREMLTEAIAYDTVREKLAHSNRYRITFRTNAGSDRYKYVDFVAGKDGDPDSPVVSVTLGFQDVDEQIRKEIASKQELNDQLAIIMQLSDNFQAIYDIDYETGAYDIYSYDNAYEDSVLKDNENGNNFYAETLKDVRRVVYPDDQELIINTFSNKEYIGKTLAEKGSFTIDYRLLVDEKPVWYRVRVAKKPGQEDRFLVGIFNVDARIRKEADYKKKLERALAVSDYFISSFVSAYYVNLTTAHCTVLRRSDELELEYPIVNDFISSIDEYIARDVHPDDRRMLSHMSRPEYIKNRLEIEPEFSTVVRDMMGGEEKFYRYQVIRGADENHAAFGFMDISKDIQKEKSAQEVLEKALDMAQSANQAKTSFLNSMSHDIRTPMNAIRGYTAMAKKHMDKTEAAYDYLNKIDISGQQLLELINQVLEMSRIESGKVKLDEVPVDLAEKSQSLDIVTAVNTEAKGISFTVQSNGLVHRNVLIDVSRVDQVITNIVGNAVKYTPEGGRIDCLFEELPCEREGYGLYRFTVADTGIGMSEEYLEHIFDEFSREKSSTVSQIQGTGLGMSIVKKLVDLLDGEIDIQSKPGEGTTVSVTLPMKWDTNPAQHEAELPDYRNISFAGKRLLLVEDNEMNREIALDILDEAGFVVDTAEDGDIAVEMVRRAANRRDSFFYDAILMDIQMPTMNGYEATKAIRELPPLDHHTPIIAVSANAFEEDRQKSLAAGMDDHIAKPIDVKQLKETLAKYL